MRIKSVGVEVKDIIISFGKSYINQFHKTQFWSGLRANLQMLELIHMFSKLLFSIL